MSPEEKPSKGSHPHMVECSICGKKISDRRNLNRHLRNIHKIEPKVREPKLNCCYNQECTFVTSTYRLLREHLKDAHDFLVEKKELSFNSREDFEAWKHEEEVSSFASYVTDTGVKCRSGKKIYYLRCHRSGHVRCDKKARVIQRKRSKPAKGYTQEGIICPSSMQISEVENGKIKVIYFSTHLGHKLDAESVKYMKLTTKEKEEIAAKLVQGEPIVKIVTDARKKKGEKLSRINLLKKRDVYNIKLKVNYLEKETDHDGLIIDSWVKKMDSGDPAKNPVVFYNPLDDSHNYFLVLIHSLQKIIYSLVHDGSIVYIKTKKGKPNVDFNLIAISILPENGEGYPIAFCVSNKTDYLTVYNFFKIVCNTLGVIHAQIFISDNICHYYTAWKNVMGECETRLLCTFDMDLIWEQKLGELKCPVEKHELISNSLKKLLKETDSDVFESELVEMLNSWNEDSDLKPFVKFFYKSYGKKPCEWANCYRIHANTKESINNNLEPLNNDLETIYQRGTSDVYSSLNLLFEFVRNECLFDLIKWDGDILNEKLKEVVASHEEFEKVVTEIHCKGSEYTVLDSSNSDFVVNKLENECEKRCRIVCENCNICIHDYNCNCNDYVIGFNICVHVHALAMSEMSQNQNGIAQVPSKLVAVSVAKSLVEHLEQSDLSDVCYQEISLSIQKIMENYLTEENKTNISSILQTCLECN